MRRSIRVACAVAAVLIVAVPAAAEEVNKEFHETFDVSEGVSLRLEYGDGDATIIPWERDAIDVVVVYRADVKVVGFGATEDFDVEFRQTDTRVTVRGVEAGSRGVFIMNYVNEYEYTYTVKAPPYVLLDLVGDDGDLSLSNWRADIECRTDDGDVKLSDVVNASTEIWIEDGDVKLSALTCELVVKSDDGDVSISGSEFDRALLSMEDGDLRVVDSRGSFDASLDDGDVTMSRVTASVIDINGNDGDVDLDVASDDDISVNVNMDDGDVTVRLHPALSFAYLVTVDDGHVDVDLDGVTNTDSSEHRVSGQVGDGGGQVRVSTADGDVELTTAR